MAILPPRPAYRVISTRDRSVAYTSRNVVACMDYVEARCRAMAADNGDAGDELDETYLHAIRLLIVDEYGTVVGSADNGFSVP